MVNYKHMNKVNLTKELEKSISNKEKEAFKNNQFITDDILKETNSLLLNAHNKDHETLEELGIKQFEFEKKLVADVVRTNRVKNIYNKSAFTGQDLKYFCNLYDLKLLRIDYYEGTIPVELARVVREFCDDRKISVSEARNNLFILAPTEMFRTIEYKPISKDPVLLFRDPERRTSSYNQERADERDVFVQVYNWGNDFNIGRRFRYLFNTTIKTSDDITSLKVTFWNILCMIVAFISGICFYNIGFGAFMFILGSLLLIFNSDSKFIDTLWNKNER